MPITRRQELLRWAAEQPERYILEDDYDSEFRFVGRPIPTLFSVSENQRVIYLNTFSKTIAPSIRISYMILPPQLLARYRERLGFYACTVSSFEQYTLARFLEQGRYEQHLNRMRTRYRQKRDAVIDAIGSSSFPDGWRYGSRTQGCTFSCICTRSSATTPCGSGRRLRACGWRCCRTTTAGPTPHPSTF